MADSLDMDVLPVEMIKEIFLRMDHRTGNKFRRASRRLNGIFLENRSAMPKVEYDLCIDYVDQFADIENVQRMWPIIKLVFHPDDPDREAIEKFDLLQIVVRPETIIAFETANVSSSLGIIFGNMSLYCNLTIGTMQWQKRLEDYFPCVQCFRQDSLTEAEKVDRRICHPCRHNEQPYCPFRTFFGRSPVHYYAIFKMKEEYDVQLPALSMTKEEIADQIVNEIPNLREPFLPFRIKFPPKMRPELVRLATRYIGRYSGDSAKTGAKVVDEHRRRLNCWIYKNEEVMLLLGHDEIIALGPLCHLTEFSHRHRFYKFTINGKSIP